MLIVAVLAGAYCLTVFDTSHREVVATLVGASATIFAGWLPWESLTFQAQRANRTKSLQAAIRKEDAVIALILLFSQGESSSKTRILNKASHAD